MRHGTWFGWLAIASLASWPLWASQSPARPNFLLLFTDDQRADTIRAWGNPYIHTPNIDRLAERGFSFRANYNLGGNTGAVCIPSRVMLHTGKAYFRVPADMSGARLFAELLREHGYRTYAIGKWHNQEPALIRGFEAGKSIMLGGMSNHLEVPLVDLVDGRLVNKRTGKKFSSELFADAAIEFLETYRDSRPFFLYVAFTAPHDPRMPPEPYREMYYRQRPLLPPNFMPQHPFNLGPTMTGRDEMLAPWPRTRPVLSDQLAEYYGMITHLDDQIGRILQALERTGLSRQTVVIFAADNGLAIGSHGLLGKQNLYEHSQRVPLIFAGPGIPHGETQAFTYLLDIFPTVCRLAGINPPTDLDGVDLAPLWRGEKRALRDSIFLAFMDWSRAVRQGPWKLIRYPQIGYLQLFNLETDPHELHNLADQPAQKQRVAALTTLLRSWQQRLGDRQPLEVQPLQPKEVDLTGLTRQPDKWQPDWIVRKYF